MKYLRHIGLVFSLLIVGVLGGLLAPLPSEAVPTLRIEVYVGTSTTPEPAGGQPIALNSAVSCTSTAQNYCYPLTAAAYTNNSNYYGPVGHQFKIEDVNSSTNPARVNINDKATASNTVPADVIVVTGMKLTPLTQWGQYDVVTVKLIVTNKFDAQPNPVANGTTSFYPFGMSVGGQYNTTPSPAGNFYQMYGRAIFTGTLNTGPWTNLFNSDNPHADFNITRGTSDTRCFGVLLPSPGTKYPLCQYIAGATAAQATFNSTQDSTNYPGGSNSQPSTTRYACTNNLTGSKQVTSTGNTNTTRPGPVGAITINYTDPTCQPTIEETHEFSIWGPDQILLTSSSHAGGGVCGENPLPSCECTTTSKGKKVESMCNSIRDFIENENKKERDDAVGIPPVIECTDEICSGQIDVTLAVNGAPTGMTFPFIALGPGLGPFLIELTGGTSGNRTGVLTEPFVKLITGRGGAEGGGTPLLIMPDYDNPAWQRPDGNSWYAVDQMIFESSNTSTVIGIDTFVDSCNGDKGPGFVYAIGRTLAGQADHLTLRIHVHSESHPPTVCPF